MRRWWHRLLHGCDAEEIRPACATCGYWIDGTAATAPGGVCPECGNVYIASTLQMRAPVPSVAWRLGWTVVPPLISLVGIVALAQWPRGATLIAFGVIAVAMALLHQQALRALRTSAASDRERGSFEIRVLAICWGMVLSFHVIAGCFMVPLGALIYLVR